MTTRPATLAFVTVLLLDFQSENSPAFLSRNTINFFVHLSIKGTLTIRGSPLFERSGGA